MYILKLFIVFCAVYKNKCLNRLKNVDLPVHVFRDFELSYARISRILVQIVRISYYFAHGNIFKYLLHFLYVYSILKNNVFNKFDF